MKLGNSRRRPVSSPKNVAAPKPRVRPPFARAAVAGLLASLPACAEGTSTAAPPRASPLGFSATDARVHDAEAALQHLETVGARPLSDADQAWLSQLQKSLGAPESPLTVEALNTDPSQLGTLRDTLRVLVAATVYQARQLSLDGTPLEAHNSEIADRLRGRYTSTQFHALFDFASQHHVFDMVADPKTGLVRTSGVTNEENAEMGARQWVTDTVRLGDLEREKDPAGWTLAMGTLARFYAQPAERAAFARAISDPQTYRDGGPREGVAHIFDPHTLQRDPAWFNNGRLESHGLALKALVDTVISGRAPENLNDVAAAISQLAQYFDAIDYPTAPSVGPWEETRLSGGLTWDTEAARSALSALRDLLFNPAHDSNPQVVKARAAIAAQPATLPTTTDRRRLDSLIERGRARVAASVHALQESGPRPFDASSVFTAASDVPLEPAEQLRLLDTVEQKLVRKNGMIRYAPFEVPLKLGAHGTSPDSYLAKNYWVALDKRGRINLEWRKRAQAFGSKDASDPEVFMARAALATPNTEAEWFMVSDLARGYGTQVQRLLASLGKRPPTPRERALIDEGLAKETRALNRAYARITGTGTVKSNGKDAPAFAVPEAFEAVSAVDGTTRYLPGADTPLGWAVASLFGASRQLLDNLERYERLFGHAG